MARIIIADDHEVIRKGLQLIFGETNDLRIVATAKSGDELIKKLQSDKVFDAVILDISMEGKNVFDTIDEIKSLQPDLPVVIFTMNTEEQYAIRLIKAGASAFVSKTKGSGELITAIRKVIKGETYFSKRVSELLIQNLITKNTKHPYELLSNREFQVMLLIAEGKELGEISDILYLGKSTVSNYRGNVLKKLNLKNNAEITKFAYQNGLVV